MSLCPNTNVFRERLKSSIDVVCRKCSGSEGQRTKMLVGRSLSMPCCSCTEGNLVDLEWRSADCGAP